jgi:arylsulfatase A-like enzyme
VILHEIERLGLDEDTIVIFTSDNGSRAVDGGSNQPLRGTKGTTWEGGMRVPGIVRWPGRIEAGRVSTEVATAMDLYPTLAGLCGATLPDDRTIDGRDISALWLDPSASSPHDVFLYYWMDDLEAVRSGRWKLHLAKHGTAFLRLHDLVADRAEATDVQADHPDVVAALLAHAERARSDLGDALTGRVGTDLRPVGCVDDPVPLTAYDPDHPYVVAEYDLPDRG